MKKKTIKRSTLTSKKRYTTMAKKVVAKTKKIKFCLEAPQASQVAIAGDFNDWSEVTLKKTRKKSWEKNFTLKPGRYEYKFVVDGNWINDPSNENTSWNAFGSQNSVLEI